VALWAVHLFHGTSLEELSSILISLIFPEHNRNLKEFILKDISSGEFNHKLPDHIFFRFDRRGIKNHLKFYAGIVQIQGDYFDNI
jgi:hypothetical protein